MKKFKSKEDGSIEVIEAIQFNGENMDDVMTLCPKATVGGKKKLFMKIETADGEVTAEKGEWIAKREPQQEGAEPVFEVYDGEGFLELFDEVDADGNVVVVAAAAPVAPTSAVEATTTEDCEHNAWQEELGGHVKCTVCGDRKIPK